MKTKRANRKIAETALGAAVGAAIAGPVGALAGGLAAGYVEEGLQRPSKLKRAQAPARIAPDDPLIHVWPKRILVPLDFSPPSKRAMRFSREWADFFSAEVCLLHVVEPTGVVGDFGKAPLGTIQRDIRGKAKAVLQELARTEFPNTIRVTTAVRKGGVSDQIAAIARDFRADLIVIASHGYTGLKRVLLGSTAERVACSAPCPVLILRRRPTSKVKVLP